MVCLESLLRGYLTLINALISNKKGPYISLSLSCLLIIGLSGCVINQTNQQAEPTALVGDLWWNSGRSALHERLSIKPNLSHAKNVILFIGDGMGVSTVTAGRIFDGQSRGEQGEENVLAFERFPYVALVKTYNTDSQVPDSAATASAMLTGVKTKIGAVGTWEYQAESDCYGPQKDFPKNLMELGEAFGIATGVVTTDKVTYATPAATYAHSPSRHWQSDGAIPSAFRDKGCVDIAKQLVEFPYGDGVDVMLGGGRAEFIPSSLGGLRQDDINLIAEWQQTSRASSYIESNTELQQLKQQSRHKLPKRVLGLFSDSHLRHNTGKSDEQPSLVDMTAFAVDVLSKNENGYFLVVENGLIDRAHHKTNAYGALSEVQAFNQAIKGTLERVDLNETLVLVTADHSHPFNILGYPVRGNPILGLVKPSTDKGSSEDLDGYSSAKDHRPYATLTYGAGPNSRSDRMDPSNTVLENKSYIQESAIPLVEGVHGGEDVALYAHGPHAFLVGGVLEQNVIFHIITQAFGWKESALRSQYKEF